MTHYFSNNENLPSKPKEINFKVKNQVYQFYTDNGVFSKKGLDFGTRLLLESIPFDKLTGPILDFGCGYGPIGIVISKETGIKVDMIDINKRSLALNIFESDIYNNISEKYNYIVTNPPIRVGKKILYQILFEAKQHLNKNGELWLVVNKDQGAKSIIKDLEKEYNVNVVNKSKGFFIICAVNN
jgi:16S rRNA (guanine1207-N2)-methyltransferase